MEKQKEMSGMLELVPQSAFLVSENVVCLMNQAARQLLIQPGTPIEALLGSSLEEYTAFEGGCLCLTLMLSGCPVQACVTRMDTVDLFVIDQPADQAELKAMALSAMGFREPLSDIITVKEHLLDILTPEQQQATQVWIGQLNRRLNQMHRMVCNMTDALQYSGDSLPRMSCQDICALLEELFDRAAVLAEQAGFRLTYRGPREAIPCLAAPERLERAVYNILSNAMKQSSAGGTIEVTLTRKGNKLYLSIQDDGPGIPSHLMTSLYSRYRRQPGIESQPVGMGLGMVLVRSTAAAHGGTVLIDQPQGRGTRVTMSLSIRTDIGNILRSEVYPVDYAGEYDHALLELSDALPAEFYV